MLQVKKYKEDLSKLPLIRNNIPVGYLSCLPEAIVDDLKGTCIDPVLKDIPSTIKLPVFLSEHENTIFFKSSAYSKIPEIMREYDDDKKWNIPVISKRVNPSKIYYLMRQKKVPLSILSTVFTLDPYIYIPPLKYRENYQSEDGTIMLNPLNREINKLVQEINYFIYLKKKNGWMSKPKWVIKVQNRYNQFNDFITSLITGKNGIITRHIVGTRMERSIRSTITPNPTIKFGELGIPKAACKRLEVVDGSWCFMVRQPSIWMGNLLGFKVKIVDGYAIQMNPMSTHPFNADHDGDQTSVYFPKDADALNDIVNVMNIKNIINVPNLFKWKLELKLSPTISDEDITLVNIQKEMERRFKDATQLGGSLGLEDLMNMSESPYVNLLNTTGAKKIDLIESSKFAKGLTKKEFFNEIKECCADYSAIKIGTAIAGSFSQKLLAVCGSKNGQWIQERLCQEVLSRKHGSNDSADVLKRMIDLFQRTGKDLPDTKEKMIKEIVSLNAAWTEDIVTDVVNNFYTWRDKYIKIYGDVVDPGLDDIIEEFLPDISICLPWASYNTIEKLVGYKPETEIGKQWMNKEKLSDDNNIEWYDFLFGDKNE